MICHLPNRSRKEIIIDAHTRKKRGRRPLPKTLPRVEIIHDLRETEKQCKCGCEMSRIGEEISEKLDIIPAKIRVERHIRYKYACKSCDGLESGPGTVRTATLPPQIIPQGIATAGLVSHIMISKFADALPFYRQEKLFERIGVELGRATMANWAIHVGRQCKPLMELMWQEIRSGPLINMDETPVQVLKEPGRANTTKSYMWVFRGGEPERPVLIYRYDPSRSGEVPRNHFSSYKGYIQTDGYCGYNALGDTPGIIHLGCWVHVRRKFVEAVKVMKKGTKGKKGYAECVLAHISELYNIEKAANKRELSFKDRQKLRNREAKPVLTRMKALLPVCVRRTGRDEAAHRTPP